MSRGSSQAPLLLKGQYLGSTGKENPTQKKTVGKGEQRWLDTSVSPAVCCQSDLLEPPAC